MTLKVISTVIVFSISCTVLMAQDFEGKWVADASSQVRYDGNRITEIIVTRNGNNYIFEFNKNDLGLRTMGATDQSNNISLYSGKWVVSLDATNSDNLFLQGSLFHRVSSRINKNNSNSQIVNSYPSLNFEGKWRADANSQVRYDGNRITEIVVTRNGNNFIFELNKNDLGLKSMGSPDRLNNISLFGGEWTVSLDAANNDVLYLEGSRFYRVGPTKGNVNNEDQVNKINTSQSFGNSEFDYKSFYGFLHTVDGDYYLRINGIDVLDESNNEYQAKKKVFDFLNTLTKAGFIKKNSVLVKDTLDLNVKISFSYRSYNMKTYISYFADCSLGLGLANKSESVNSSKIYSISNYGLLKRGFASKIEANKDLIDKNFYEPIFIFFAANFPFYGEIMEVTERNKKEDEAKSVKINLGKQDGMVTGVSFYVLDINNGSEKPDLIVTEVFQDYSICKVKENEKSILSKSNAGLKLKIKSTYKP